MKIIFTYYPAKVRYNHGVALLTALCRKAGINAYIIPMDGLADLCSKVKQAMPDYICVSYISSGDYYLAMPFVKALRALGTPMIAGGVYARRGAWIKPELFDYICRGEAEEGLTGFFLNGDTAVFDEKQYCEDISALPLPDYSAVSGYEFARDYPFLQGKKIIPYCGSRGCPYKCSFCEIKYQPKSIRIRNSIRQDLDFLYERYMPDLFYFLDTLLPYYDDEWRTRFEGNQYPFFAYIRADIKPEHLEFLHKNGMTFCAFGVESGVEQHRNDVLHKDLSDDEVWRTVAKLKQLGVYYASFFMTGTPYETEAIKQKTIEMYYAIGGYPTIWEYEDIGKKVFSVTDQDISEYCKLVDRNEIELRTTFDREETFLEGSDGKLLSYEVFPDCIFANDFFGDGDWAVACLDKACKRWGKERIRGFVRSSAESYLRLVKRKWNFESIGHIIERKVL